MKRLIEELKRLKNEAYEFPKTDYNDGWISAIETVEEIVEEDGDKYRWHDIRKNPEDLPEIRHYVLLCDEFAKGDLVYTQGARIAGDWSVYGNVIGWREIEPFEEDEE